MNIVFWAITALCFLFIGWCYVSMRKIDARQQKAADAEAEDDDDRQGIFADRRSK